MSDKNDEILEKLNNFIDSSENEMIFLESLLTKHKALSPENGGDGEEEKAPRRAGYRALFRKRAAVDRRRSVAVASICAV